MKPKSTPSPESLAMIDAAFSSDPTDWDDWSRSQGVQPHPDLPVCLANLPPSDWVECCKVMPPPAIQQYLDSGDVLTQFTIDRMEDAMERDYKVADPWTISSDTTGSEADETLAVKYFLLLKR